MYIHSNTSCTCIDIPTHTKKIKQKPIQVWEIQMACSHVAGKAWIHRAPLFLEVSIQLRATQEQFEEKKKKTVVIKKLWERSSRGVRLPGNSVPRSTKARALTPPRSIPIQTFYMNSHVRKFWLRRVLLGCYYSLQCKIT